MAVVAMMAGMPYSFFMLLRVVMCGVMLLAAWQCFESKRGAHAWGCVAVAVLFNPVLKVHLTRDLWWFIDGTAAVWCLVLVKQTGESKA